MPETTATTTPVAQVLAQAVSGLGGQQRDGQVQMATEVAEAMEEGRHLLVQAGTGTGKSLGYLVPAMLHDKRVVVATATLALQHQLVERDLPRLVEAVKDVPGIDTSYAVLKGRSNYACLHRIRAGVPDDQGMLVDVPMGSMAEKVLELRAWAEEETEQGGSGERDNAPRHTDREWRQVSVNHRECLGGTKCPFGAECFAELAREKAHRSHLIVTNHSLLAIDAIEDVPMIPDYDTVVIDEAHELTARVTQAATDELGANDVERAARRSMRWTADAESDPAGDLEDAAGQLAEAFEATGPGRIDQVSQQLSDALVVVRDSARAVLSAYPRESPGEGEADAGRTQAKGMVQEVFVNAERMAADSDRDVLWLGEARDRFPARLHVAPLQVWGPMRDKLLTDKTVIFTSATLMLGGDFGTVATTLGLKPTERIGHEIATTDAEDALPWKGIDVGSPFDYGQQSILYVARHLPQPGRDGLGQAQLDEICDLVDSLDGRTLGLFSSRRAAETAAEAVRAKLPHLTTLAQGDAQLPELAKQFVEDPHTCLFGTLSLWQGLDVPGDTCQLVIIDRIPFPRPDDPLMSARAKAADAEGRNGFMEVSATHAALLLAQGAGRLIRTTTDRGIVAVLDPRLETARYGRFLKASLPPMWSTTDPALVRQALARLGQARST
ncbi:ATP-dependent DNA helicase DinG [Nocardioides sp. BE266]|nr:ATP-dependent DNA helicase [Nocardioides sp. BE266]MDR7252246.1 ATP-dependent DNA helicase DinG [Nocardioides sp. BE266]